MQHSVRVLSVGVALLLAAILLDSVGTQYQLLAVLILALCFAVAGALLAMRGTIEFLGEQFSKRASKRPDAQTGSP